jgi:hypothetical protein
MSVCISMAPSEHIPVKFYIGDFYENLSIECTLGTFGTLHVDFSTDDESRLDKLYPLFSSHKFNPELLSES